MDDPQISLCYVISVMFNFGMDNQMNNHGKHNVLLLVKFEKIEKTHHPPAGPRNGTPSPMNPMKKGIPKAYRSNPQS